MAALDFPAAPDVNDTHTQNGRTWMWNGESWRTAGAVGVGALDFPAAPSVNDIHTQNGWRWLWNGQSWRSYGEEAGDGDGNLYKIVLTVASGAVASNLTNYPIMVDLAGLPAGFWSHVKADGGDIRVYTPGGTKLARDLVKIDGGTDSGILFFFAPSVLSGSDNTWEIRYGNASLSNPADGDADGRNAVWAGYEVVSIMVASIEDRTGKYTFATETGTASFEAITMGAGGGLNVAADTQFQALDQLTGNIPTIYTIGVSGSISDVSGSVNRQFCCYSRGLSENIGRSTVGFHNVTGDPWTQFDNGNSFNDGSAVVTNTVYRFHAVWNGSTHNRLYKNGVQDAEDATVTGQNADTNDSFFIGGGGTTSSYLRGKVGFVWLRHDIPPPAWFVAEHSNLSAPGSFYSLGSEESL